MTNELFKEQKKQLTKDLNKFSNEALKFFRKNRKELNKTDLDTLVNDEFYNDICKYENGKEKVMCGVMIGRGKKIHIMEVGISFDEKLGEYYIRVGNYTQWRKSDLIVIDVVDKIPDEVKAYFNK